MRPLDAMCRTPWTVSGVAVAVVFGLGACGGDDDFDDDERDDDSDDDFDDDRDDD